MTTPEPLSTLTFKFEKDGQTYSYRVLFFTPEGEWSPEDIEVALCRLKNYKNWPPATTEKL